MKRAMTLKTRFILTSYCSIVISVFLICIVSYVLLGNLSRKFAIQANQEAVRQKNEDISGRVNGIEVTIRDIIYNSELQKLLNEPDGIYIPRYLLFNSKGELVLPSTKKPSEGQALYDEILSALK